MTSPTPDVGFPPDPTIDLDGSPNKIGPKLPIPHLGIKPDAYRPWWFVVSVFLGQFGLFVALLAPATVSIQVKAQAIASTPAEAVSIAAMVTTPGALAALIFNVLGGRLSDRTTGRFGRRRPWIVGGAIAMVLSTLLIALGTTTLVMAIGWFLAQATANAAFAAYTASVAEQVPERQYGRVSGVVGMAQNVGIMAATWITAWLDSNMFLLFMVPALVGFVLMTVYALTLPEPVLKENRYPFDWKGLLLSFWINPIKHPDFGLAWLGRFLIILASYLFITTRVFYMTGHLGIPEGDATSAVATGVTIYTVVAVFASVLGGWLSDLLKRRKILVAIAIVIFALGTYMLLHVDTLGGFYAAEAIMGFAYGMYLAVDLALVFDVLPDRENTGKDLGVFNMANALPQSLAPGIGGFLLATLGGGTDFTVLLTVAAIVGLAGAVVTLFIRGVK